MLTSNRTRRDAPQDWSRTTAAIEVPFTDVSGSVACFTKVVCESLEVRG